MPPRRPPPNHIAQLLHLDYEVEQLAVATVAVLRVEELLTKRIKNRDHFLRGLTNALLESVMIHLRTIDAFLRGTGAGDDLVPTDFVAEWTPVEILTPEQRRRVNKEVAHLTYERSDFGDPIRAIHADVMFKAICEMAGFYSAIGREMPHVAATLLADWQKRGLRRR